MKLYRVQSIENAGSLWYNPDGTPNRVVDKLSNDTLAKLPMDFDPRYREDGRIWQCATSDIDNFNYWFSLQDYTELIDMGYKAVKFDTNEFIKEEHQTLFTMKSITNV